VQISAKAANKYHKAVILLYLIDNQKEKTNRETQSSSRCGCRYAVKEKWLTNLQNVLAAISGICYFPANVFISLIIYTVKRFVENRFQLENKYHEYIASRQGRRVNESTRDCRSSDP